MARPDPAKRESRYPIPSLVIGFVAASLSGVAVLLHAFGAVHLGFSVILFAPATVVLILIIATRTQSSARSIFLQRLAGGLFAGCIGIVAYDAVRWLVLVSGFVPFNPFR